MITALCIAALVVVLAFALVCAALVAHLRGSPARPAVEGLRRGEMVIVNTRRPDEQSIRGVVVRELDGGLELTAAELLQPDGTSIEIAGGAWVPRGSISFVQLVPAFAQVVQSKG